MTDQNEARLVKRAKQGDMHAFEELIIQHEKIVYNVALRMMNHSEDAKDISQEVFLKAYRFLPGFTALRRIPALMKCESGRAGRAFR